MDHLTRHLSTAHWRKSSLSGHDGSNCVEVAALPGGHRGVRDSKDPHGPALILTPRTWTAFLTAVKNGDFDH